MGPVNKLAARIARRFRSEPDPLRPRIGTGPGRASPYLFTLTAALATHGSLRIVVVGANDGRINDPIFPFVEKFKASTELFLIEPQKALIPYLRANYGFHPRANIINHAVGPTGTIILYTVDEAAWPLLHVPYANGWPAYRAPTGVTSGDRNHVRRWLRKFGPKGADVDSMIAEQAVKSAPLPKLLQDSLTGSIDVLQVDAEGMDDVVIYNCGIDELKPSIIYFEAKTLPNDRAMKLIAYLEERGYMLATIRKDILAVRSDPAHRN